VPEFGALIDAARRGVQVPFLLDGTIGKRTAAALAGFATRKGLPLSVQTTRRLMHQKYLCCADTGMVPSGNANMTEDATQRHSDHRILWRDAPKLAAAFAADFDTISARLALPFFPCPFSVLSFCLAPVADADDLLIMGVADKGFGQTSRFSFETAFRACGIRADWETPLAHLAA